MDYEGTGTLMGPSGPCSELIYCFDMSYGGWIKDENIHNYYIYISVLQFYEYIREISVDILTQNIDGQKIIQTHGNVRKNS